MYTDPSDSISVVREGTDPNRGMLLHEFKNHREINGTRYYMKLSGGDDDIASGNLVVDGTK